MTMLCDVRDRVPGRAERGGTGPVFICPSLSGLPMPAGLWLSILPIHDANAYVDEDWVLEGPASERDRLYFGVFALDRLRSPDRLLERLRAKGVSRIANLPTVSFFDATTAANLGALGFRPERELAFLLQARRAGFGVAFCTGQESSVGPAERRELDFVIVHDRPGAALSVFPA
jgi:predicted TIM-barrel enzyme